MPAVTHVKKSQKPQTCEKCGKKIPVGSPYKHCSPRAHRAARGHKRIRCDSCPSWRPSELTSSGALSALYGAQESAEDALDEWDGESIDDVRSILEDCASGIREAAETYRESAQNIEDGFGHSTSTSEDLVAKADNLESGADEVESVDLEDFDDEPDADVQEEALRAMLDGMGIEIPDEIGEKIIDGMLEWARKLEGWQDAVFEEAVDKLMDEKRSEWADEVRDAVRDAISSVSPD